MLKIGKLAKEFKDNICDKLAPHVSKLNSAIMGDDYRASPNSDNLISHAASGDNRMKGASNEMLGRGTIHAPLPIRKSTNEFKS